MVDPLSTVANAVAIVGLVDVSFRAAKELYVFFSAVKGASKEVKSLRNERQDINLAPLRQWGISSFLLRVRCNCHEFTAESTRFQERDGMKALRYSLKPGSHA